jgi:aldose 1-epimerase
MPEEPLHLRSDDVELVVLPALGARFHRLRAFGHDVLRTPAAVSQHRTEPFVWGAYVMAPWCNRIDAVPTAVAGRTITAPPNFADGTAIHGLVHDRPWVAVGEGRLRTEIEPGAWPWRARVEMDLDLAGGELAVELTLTNLDDEAMPGGLGLHPWFPEPVTVTLPGRSVFRSNLDSTARPEPVDQLHDRRRGGPFPIGVDATWTDLERPAVDLAWPAAGIAATLSLGSEVHHVVGARLPGIDAVAVEPQSHAPNGLRRLLAGEPGALSLVAPGATLILGFRLRFTRPAR